MKITPELWQEIHSSSLLHVVSCAGMWVDIDTEPSSYTGLVLELKFDDQPASFKVLYRLEPAMALQVANELIAHASAPFDY